MLKRYILNNFIQYYLLFDYFAILSASEEIKCKFLKSSEQYLLWVVVDEALPAQYSPISISYYRKAIQFENDIYCGPLPPLKAKEVITLNVLRTATCPSL